MKHHRYLLLVSILSLALDTFAQNQSPNGSQILTEKRLTEWAKTKSVGQFQSEAQAERAELERSLFDERYQMNLKSQYSIKKSNEKPLNLTEPAISPQEIWTVGLEKRLPLGVVLNTGPFGQRFSLADGTVRNTVQIGFLVGAQLDLWKNIFGRLDRAELRSQSARVERARLEKEISEKRNEINLRKAFWSLVAADQSIELSRRLIKTAELQLRDSKSRARQGAGDRGEVARSQAQVESRNASLLLFEYEREGIVQLLQKNLEGFDENQWTLDPRAEVSASVEIRSCLQQIATQGSQNTGASSLEKIIQLLDSQTEADLAVANLHDDIELGLSAQYQTTGVGLGSYSLARTDLEESSRASTTVGLNLQIPLGTSSRNSERALVAATRSGLQAEKLNLTNELESTHRTMIRGIKLLSEGLEKQSQNSRNLEVSLKETERKYRQGRIPISTLILEQDLLFSSQVQQISIKRQVAHLLLDYFSVFNRYACPWNNI